MRNKTKVIDAGLRRVDRAAKYFKLSPHKEARETVSNLYRNLETNHGTRFATATLKSLYNDAVRYSLGATIKESSPLWLKRDGNKFPLALKCFKPLLKDPNPQVVRISLSYLRVFELIELEPVKSVKTIITPSLGQEHYVSSIRNNFSKFLLNSKFSFRVRKLFREAIAQVSEDKSLDLPAMTFTNDLVELIVLRIRLHLSLRKGPGGPTCATAGYQSLAISPQMHQLLVNMYLRLRGQEPAKYWDFILKQTIEWHQEPGDKDLIDNSKYEDLCRKWMGRITCIPDKGGKTRVIAIGNYWVQDCLKGLHDAAYKVLRSLETDGTYNQGGASDAARIASSKGPTWSYDLTAATDRFPLMPQVDTLKSLDPVIGDLWEKILKNINFNFEGQPVEYKVGQPMGLYSSWAIFALTHHMIIQYCAWSVGEKYPFTQYRVLGDDVIIWSVRTAKKYKEVLNILQVEISEAKSFEPISNEIGPAEFAKRIYLKGIEYTPISPGILKAAEDNIENIIELLNWLNSHGWDIREVPPQELLDTLNTKSLRKKRGLQDALYLNHLLGRPVPNGVRPFSESLCYLDAVGVQHLRVIKLVEQALELLNKFNDSSREMLEKHLTGPTPPVHYFEVIWASMAANKIEMAQRILSRLTSIEEDMLQRLNVPDLEEIEFCSFSDLENLLHDVVVSEDKKTRRAKFLVDLAEKARKVLSKENYSYQLGGFLATSGESKNLGIPDLVVMMTPEMDSKFREQHGIVNYSLDRFAGVPYTWDSSLEEIISFLDSRDLVECPLSNYSTEYIREWSRYRGYISLDDMTRLEAEGRTPF